MPTVKHVAMATAFALHLIPENDTISESKIVKGQRLAAC
jgi:hypothetical protein